MMEAACACCQLLILFVVGFGNINNLGRISEQRGDGAVAIADQIALKGDDQHFCFSAQMDHNWEMDNSCGKMWDRS